MTEIVQKPVGRARALERRRRLLDVARALFVTQGFHQTGMALIASESGIAVGQIYRDFKTKGDIISAICEADVTAWLEEETLTAAVVSGDPQEIRRWLERFSEQEDDDGMLPEILAEATRNAEVAALCRTMDERVRNSLSTALRAISPAGFTEDKLALKVELILTLGFGARCRQIMRPNLDRGMFQAIIGYVFDSDLSRIGGGQEAGG